MPHQTEEEALGVWRQAKELLFLASIGDVERMQALVEKHRASVSILHGRQPSNTCSKHSPNSSRLSINNGGIGFANALSSK